MGDPTFSWAIAATFKQPRSAPTEPGQLVAVVFLTVVQLHTFHTVIYQSPSSTLDRPPPRESARVPPSVQPHPRIRSYGHGDLLAFSRPPGSVHRGKKFRDHVPSRGFLASNTQHREPAFQLGNWRLGSSKSDTRLGPGVQRSDTYSVARRHGSCTISLAWTSSERLPRPASDRGRQILRDRLQLSSVRLCCSQSVARRFRKCSEASWTPLAVRSTGGLLSAAEYDIIHEVIAESRSRRQYFNPGPPALRG